ncbi:MAG: endolytic transglycosylase MltG [Sneathiella sp.]|nr:endolytic transglycosylase MltG [Sneathiella sp.]
MKRFLILLIGLFLIFNIGLASLAGYGWHLFTKPGPLSESRAFLLEKGTGLRTIARQLQDQGIIENDLAFVFGVRLKEQQAKLKAGEFEFAPGMSAEEVMGTIVSGKTISYPLTIPEGLEGREIVDLLMGEPKLTGEIENIPPEGAILPETYHFTRGDKRSDVLKRMQTAMDQAIATLLADFTPGKYIKDRNDVLTLASIVEKETAVASERPHVAGVFYNRLRKGMRLQSDPTVIYGVTRGERALGRPIYKSDLKDDNPFNTYVIDGLPPAPISNPGLESIKAVLNPMETDDLYFVASGDGGHAFAKTLAEHNRNVRAWRKLQKSRNAQ